MPKIAIICFMRKGSKRFPGKNTISLFGIPLYLWTINFFKEFKYPFYLFHDYNNLYIPDWVIEIKRDPEFTGDIHNTAGEIRWSNIDADIFILLQVTSPFRDQEQVKYWIDGFFQGDYDCGFSALPLKSGFYFDGFGKELNFKQASRTYNGTSKNEVFRETGSFYIFKKKMLLKKHILDSDNKVIFGDPYGIDIDTAEDLREVECRLKRA